MPKFDVYRLQDGGGLVLDCQADLLSDFGTRFVVPLLSCGEAPKPVARLNPIFTIEGRDYVMLPQLAASIPSSELQLKVTSLRDHDLTVGNALDMLISGF
ncbi:CcdB family protein [Novosphingobium sp. AP12]|uniref:CcdB family protein n=1 Tax=Novosphingobium sp. AP12 TaxID=1144305 RepID=UPI0002721F5A|nr:CcdB family protein [Novosphingobium sp. AP12]EJL23608.1 CcdB protein [Novosphingobium sp. AP12]